MKPITSIRLPPAARKGEMEDAVRITINGVNGFDGYDELPSERKQHLLAKLCHPQSAVAR